MENVSNRGWFFCGILKPVSRTKSQYLHYYTTNVTPSEDSIKSLVMDRENAHNGAS